MKLSISIVIPTFNGLTLLKKHLPSVVKYSHGAEILVVDDASTDSSVAWLKQEYPQIKVVQQTHNQGFAAAVNRGFRTATTDLVLLLNNDVSLKKNTLLNLAQNFLDNPKLFGVGALELLPKGANRGKSIGKFSRGLLVHQAGDIKTPGPTLWVFAASGLFSRKIWLKLSGMDELYRPAYWEDIDIGYRAWKAGYICWFDPTATLIHQAESTMNKELGWKKQIYAFKNQLLFFWKNVTSPSLIGQHLLWFPYHLVVTSIRSRGAFLLGVIYALIQMPQVSNQTKSYKDNRTDKQIVNQLLH